MSHRDNTKNYDVGGINCSELKRNVQQCWHNLARDTETVDAGWNALKEYLSCQNIKAMQEEDCIDMGKKVRHIYWAMKYVLHGNCIYGNDKAVQNQKFGTAPRSTARRCSFMSGMTLSTLRIVIHAYMLRFMLININDQQGRVREKRPCYDTLRSIIMHSGCFWKA